MVLILLTGFAIYMLHISEIEDYTDILHDMRQLDAKRNKETIEFVSVLATTENKINITIKNLGTHQAHLIYIGVMDEAASPDIQNYYEIDTYINPMEIVTNITNSTITITTGQLRIIQLVTDLGNVFSFNYPQTTASTGTTYDFVDETYDSGAVGTHGFFSAEQAGPDGVVDSLTEENMGSGTYTELWSNTFKPSTAGTWEEVDLSLYGVPANSVAIIHIYQDGDSGEWDAGVRATGSSLDRCIPMHEAEGGGLVIVSLMVQVDGNAKVEIYSEIIVTDTISFRVIGYFSGFTYTELFEHWNPDYSGTWTDKDLYADYGVPKGHVAEVFLANAAGNREQYLGVRTDGSSLDRYVQIHESEGGGQDGFTMCVKTNSSTGRIECYNFDDTGHFYLLGYFDSDMDYVERMDGLSSSSQDVWEDEPLSTSGNAVVETLVKNNRKNNERYGGARTNPSSLDRRIQIHEAEAGGVTGGRWCVQSDGSGIIEIYEDDSQVDFNLVGYWIVGTSYQLLREVRWTSADFDEDNEWLCIYGATMAGEDLLVDVWDGSGWTTIIQELSSGWNSVDISSYLTSATFRIRYRDSLSNDTSQDSWEIDAAFLHTWS